jgi:hypothetical protein
MRIKQANKSQMQSSLYLRIYWTTNSKGDNFQNQQSGHEQTYDLEARIFQGGLRTYLGREQLQAKKCHS